MSVLGNPTWYHQLIRKYIVVFGRIFSDIEIQRTINDMDDVLDFRDADFDVNAKLAKAANVRIIHADDQRLDAMVGTRRHQGVVARAGGATLLMVSFAGSRPF